MTPQGSWPRSTHPATPAQPPQCAGGQVEEEEEDKDKDSSDLPGGEGESLSTAAVVRVVACHAMPCHAMAPDL